MPNDINTAKVALKVTNEYNKKITMLYLDCNKDIKNVNRLYTLTLWSKMLLIGIINAILLKYVNIDNVIMYYSFSIIVGFIFCLSVMGDIGRTNRKLDKIKQYFDYNSDIIYAEQLGLLKSLGAEEQYILEPNDLKNQLN